MRLTKILVGILLGALMLGVAGCGGEDGGNTLANFQGRWIGNQRFISIFGIVADNGTMDVRISSDGFIFGSFQRFSDGEVTSVQGSVNQGGTMTLQWQFTGENVRTAEGEVAADQDFMAPTSVDRTIPVHDAITEIGTLQFDASRVSFD